MFNVKNSSLLHYSWASGMNQKKIHFHHIHSCLYDKRKWWSELWQAYWELRLKTDYKMEGILLLDQKKKEKKEALWLLVHSSVRHTHTGSPSLSSLLPVTVRPHTLIRSRYGFKGSFRLPLSGEGSDCYLNSRVSVASPHPNLNKWTKALMDGALRERALHRHNPNGNTMEGQLEQRVRNTVWRKKTQEKVRERTGNQKKHRH